MHPLYRWIWIIAIIIPKTILYSANVNVTTNADSGSGSLRAAIEQINSGTDGSNTITMQITGNSPISLSSDLPVIKKNTVINSIGKQPIDGNGQYRLFATIMADLTLTNCTLQNGAAIGGDGSQGDASGGGMGAGGAIYIDRNKTLILNNLSAVHNVAKGGNGSTRPSPIRQSGGGGASFSTADKNGSSHRGGGDNPGFGSRGGSGNNSGIGYGAGAGGYVRGSSPGLGGGNATGKDGSDKKGGDGGYCGGGGLGGSNNSGGGGGDGGGDGGGGGGGGFGSGGAQFGGGGFGGGGGFRGGGGFGGGGANDSYGGRFGGDGNHRSRAGGGAGLGGAIFVGDSATCIIKDDINISGNSALGGQGGNPGQGYASDIFLFREAKVIFDNQQPLNAPYSIMADQKAPDDHLDSGIVKQGPGQLTLSNTDNNYRGGTSIEEGTLAFNNPKALSNGTLTLQGGALQSNTSTTLPNTINLQGGAINTPDGITLTTSGTLTGNTLRKTGRGTLHPRSTNNNYEGGTEIQEGTLSIADPKVLGSQSSNITLNGGSLQPTKTMALPNPIVADSGGSIDTPDGTTLTTTGNISGSGTLNKRSPGSWIHKGNASHTGPLNLSQGTLENSGTLASQITSSQGTQLINNGTLDGFLTNNGTTVNNAVINGAVTNNGQFNNPGIITGEFTNNNRLTSNGTTSGNIQNNGTINATGTLGWNVNNNGILKPGEDQLASLTIGGDFTQTTSGRLMLQMKPNKLADHLQIQGKAKLQGTLDLELEPGIYQKNQQYNLIHAGGGIDSDSFFDQITTNSKVKGLIQIDPNDFNLIFDNPQIILPVATNTLPANQKKLSNYLFCDNFPFENNKLVNLLQNLFSLTPSSYIKALATLTPEHYGALPIGESRAIHYLLTQNIPSCVPNCPTTTHTLTALPLYHTNHIQKHKSLPNYVQNSGGLRISYAIAYPTPFESKATISYLHTHTNWGDHRGQADSNGLYLDAGIHYSIKNFVASLALLGGYSYTNATHNLTICYPIQATSTPHIWDLAESLSLQYTHLYRSIAIIPRVVLTQTNIYFSSLCEDKPKRLNLQTDAKYFGFFDTLLSLRIQAQKSHCYCCVKPYVDLGWHNSSHLSNREFHSRIHNYTACACSFSTQTYCGSTNRFFMEWGIAFSFMNNVDLLLNSRTEMAKGDFVQGVNLGASWRF